jgi:hypothetical protein
MPVIPKVQNNAYMYAEYIVMYITRNKVDKYSSVI